MGTDIGARAPVRRGAAARSQEISRVFQALADPTRRAVVERLARGPASTTELARPFDMALPSFAQHLAMLERCGMVRSRKEGRVRRFQLAPKPLATAEGWMAEQHEIWNQRLDQMQDYVKGVKAAKR
ncbi:MAG: metalloregulator ArsR/SmtB family transcription factor [Pseudomonadota bacterium]|nr:metalloregulator ArsR/SmtB family transcription factor [Pseudomonadota bacterium]